MEGVQSGCSWMFTDIDNIIRVVVVIVVGENSWTNNVQIFGWYRTSAKIGASVASRSSFLLSDDRMVPIQPHSNVTFCKCR